MNKYIYIAFIFIGLFSCQKEDFTITNLNGDYIQVLGHGGMGMVANAYPINSLESIALCIQNDAHGSEIDIQLTQDGVLVAYHDHDLSSSTDNSGVIHSMDWSQVQQSNYTNLPYQNYHIATLDQIFSAITDYESKIFTLDVKLYPNGTDYTTYIDEYTDAIIALFDTYGLEDNVYLESQTLEFLTVMQAKKPNYQLYIYPQTFEEGLATVLQLGIKGMSISNEVITAEQVQEAHDLGVYVTIWGVDTKEENIDAVRKNPDMIQTDEVTYLVDLLQ